MAEKTKVLSDGGEFSDEVHMDMVDGRELDRNPRFADQMALVNEDEDRAREAEANRLPDRPSDSDNKDAWVDYCVALGAQVEALTDYTYHTISGKGTDPTVIGEYEDPSYTKDELIDLADRLGG